MTSARSIDRERRVHPRRRVFKRAKAVLHDNHSVIDCIMRDVSAGGARLSCGLPAQLPQTFYLVVMPEREMREVRVAWRSMTELGVAFTSLPRKALHLLL